MPQEGEYEANNQKSDNIMLTDLKNLAKHSSIYGISNLLQKGIGFIMIPVYTRYLTPSDYGILELLDLTINVISMILGVRLGTAIIRYYHHYESSEDQNEVISTAFIFVSIATLLTVGILECFTRPISGVILGNSDYFRYFQVILLSMGFQAIYSIPENYLLAQNKSLIYSAFSMATLISNLTFNILFIVVYRMGVMGMLLSMIITKFMSFVGLLFVIRHIRLSLSWKKLWEMLKFGMPLVPESFCLFIMHYADRFFVQKYCDLSELGQYSLGYKFGMILSILISEPFYRTWNTQRFEIAKREDAKYTFGKVLTYFSAVALFAGLGISVFINEVMYIMAPKEYQGATGVVALVVLSYILYGVAQYFSLGIMLSYQTKYAAYIQMVVAGLNLLFNWFFISRYGVIGAAIATVMSFLSLAVLTLMVSQRLYYVKFEYGRIATLFIVTAIVYGLSQMIHTPSVWAAIGMKVAVMLSFPLFLFAMKFFTKQELDKAEKLIKARFSKFGISE